MQFSTSQLAIIALSLTAVNADLFGNLISDIGANQNEYLSYIGAQSTGDYNDLLSLYQAAATYTDESFTTLISPSVSSEISNFVTGLPWATRILDSAPASSSESSSSAPVSSEASSSSVPVTSSGAASSEASSAAVSSGVSSSSEASSSGASSGASSEATSSKAASSSAVASSSDSAASSASSTGGANQIAVVGGLALLPAFFALI